MSVWAWIVFHCILDLQELAFLQIFYFYRRCVYVTDSNLQFDLLL